MPGLKKNRDIFDLIKFCLSVCIIIIHTNVFPDLFYPWTRVAVPLFFIMSSYLVFSKTRELSIDEKWTVTLKSCKRLFKLYLFWFIVLLPITLINRRALFQEPFLKAFLLFIKESLFCGFFPASWYLIASIESLLLLTFISSVKNIFI